MCMSQWVHEEKDMTFTGGGEEVGEGEEAEAEAGDVGEVEMAVVELSAQIQIHL